MLVASPCVDDNSSCFSFLAAISSSVMLPRAGVYPISVGLFLFIGAPGKNRVNSLQYLHMILAHAEQFRRNLVKIHQPKDGKVGKH